MSAIQVFLLANLNKKEKHVFKHNQYGCINKIDNVNLSLNKSHIGKKYL
jgi:hypothetical protein